MLRTAIPALLAVLALACGGKDKADTTTPTGGTGDVNPCANPCASANPCANANPCAANNNTAAAADPALIAKGATVFEDSCSLCHGDSGEGNKKTPAVKGAGALSKFPTDDGLLEYTKKEMPKDDPGGLSDDDYRAVVAWMRAQ
jgi:mono/diheme cytochrome c family protein